MVEMRILPVTEKLFTDLRANAQLLPTENHEKWQIAMIVYNFKPE